MGWIILVWVIALPLIGLGTWGTYHFLTSDYNREKKPVLGYVLLGISIIVLVVGIVLSVQLTGTESFKRFQKSLDSEFKGGITREVIVYSEGGEEIFREQGRFDVEHSNERLKWVDESGKVQIIYLGRSSTAIVNEK